MLINKYLPAYQFSEQSSIKINGSYPDIYQSMLQADLKSVRVIQLLFKLRGIQPGLSTISDLTRLGFVKLDEHPGREIIYGMLTNSTTFSSCVSDVSPQHFIADANASGLKVVINFKLQHLINSQHIISTESRVWCGSKVKLRFACYWFFVKPFSQLIRKLMLKQMAKEIVRPAMLYKV